MTSNVIDKLGGEHLDQFCRYVYCRDYEKAVLALMEILHAIELGGLALKTNASQSELRRICTIISSAVTAMFLDPGFGLNRQGFSALMVLKCHLRSVFAVSGFGDMSHIMGGIGVRRAGRVDLTGESDVQKYLLTCSLDIAPDDIATLVSQLGDEQKLLFWLSCLDNKYVVNRRESDLRLEMLKLGASLGQASANSLVEVQSITRAWMFCSYWDYPEKHDVKKALNRVLRNTLSKLGVVEPTLPKRVEKDKPKLLIVLELWHYDGAMFRCYAQAISNLRAHFQIVAMVPATLADERSKEMFDDIVEFSVETPIKKLIGLVIKQSPDIIFYPSVGMHQTTVQFAQLRLANIQVMSAGHPASSFSPAIDYMVFEEDFLNEADCFSEQLILLRRGAISLTRPSSAVPEPIVRNKPDTIQIAVNSMYFKLTTTFLEVCEQIARRTTRAVKFHFVIGLNVFNRAPIEKTIGSVVTNFACYEHMEYSRYASVLNTCDLQLVPFPFGNTNSFVDASLLGLPSVCLDGTEIHSHTDAVFGQRIGLPQECIAKDVDGFVEAAVHLIEDDEHRVALSESVLDADLDKNLFGEGDDITNREDLANAFKFLIAKHEEIQASGQKVWRIADRDSLIADIAS